MKIKHVSDYAKARRAAYPDIGDQLDALWHAMDSGQAPKSEPFYGMIKSVKESIPKPGEKDYDSLGSCE